MREGFGAPSELKWWIIKFNLATGERATLANVSAVSIQGAVMVSIGCIVCGAFPLCNASSARVAGTPARVMPVPSFLLPPIPAERRHDSRRRSPSMTDFGSPPQRNGLRPGVGPSPQNPMTASLGSDGLRAFPRPRCGVTQTKEAQHDRHDQHPPQQSHKPFTCTRTFFASPLLHQPKNIRPKSTWNHQKAKQDRNDLPFSALSKILRDRCLSPASDCYLVLNSVTISQKECCRSISSKGTQKSRNGEEH